MVWTDGLTYTDYVIVDADHLKDYYWGANKQSYNGFYCAQIGSTLVFNHTFVAGDPQFGGEILVPIYAFADDITDANPTTDEVQVNDPDWLTTRVAAAYVRNDLTRRARYPELLSEANEIMDRMKSDNEGQLTLVDRPWRPPSGLNSDSAWY